MKGVVLAGGLGSRLSPLTRITNKHLLPVYNQPMIYYPIKALINAGIEHSVGIVADPRWQALFGGRGAGTVRPGLQQRQGVEDGLERLSGFLGPADHHAVAVLQSPHAARRADVGVADAVCGERERCG